MEGKILSNRMINKYSFVLFVLILYSVGMTVPSFFEKDAVKKMKIMTSIFPLMEFTKAVAGDRGEVNLLLPPGAEVHTWQPKPSDIVKLSSADLFVYIGADLEPWAEDILRSVKNPRLRTVEVSKDLLTLTHNSTPSHGRRAVDPHVWLDFDNDQKIIDKLAITLGEMDPRGASSYRKNAIIYNRKLQELDDRYSKSLRDCEQRTIILAGHSAFGYLTRKYSLSQVSLYGLSPDSKPTPSQLVDIIELIKQKGIKAIYFEVSVSTELGKVIAEETGARTLVLNPGANLSKKQIESGVSFLDIMQNNLENLKDGLSCQ